MLGDGPSDIILRGMNEHSVRVLEFQKIVDKVKEQAVCDLGKQAASRLLPTSDLELARKWQRETSEAEAILRSEGNIPLGGVRDVRTLVEKARLEATLQPEELLDLSQTLAAGRRVRSFLVARGDDYPLVCEIAKRIVVLEKFEAEVRRCIADNGEVLDSASAALASTRSAVKSTHGRLMDRLNNILRARELRTAIQDPVITLREDRYCIPVKSEYRSQMPGIIHDSSASGATVFIEPAVVVELGNDLKTLVIKEREEVEKVLAKLTAIATTSAADIATTLDALAEIDFIAARANLSLLQNAVEPELNREGRLEMRQARHPLLTGDVVPIDVELGIKFRALLITGPNTGGKTVTLKTIGLLTLMAQSGLHVPAAPGAQLAVFDEVLADIGDEQSIEQSLSTFSSHIGAIVEALKSLTPNSLALLDEIGAGTDPAEGAALAKALLDHLVEAGVRTVATTHYGELKEFAFVREQVENACVEFDLETLRPTYHLTIGVPGSSNAFAIASRLGVPEQIVRAAESELHGRRDKSADIIRSIEEARRATMDDQRSAQKARVDIESLRRRYEEQVGKAEETRRKARQAVKEDAENIIRKYTKRLDRALEQLSAQKAESKRAQKLKQDIEKTLDEVESLLVETAPDFEEEPVGEYTFHVGETVRVATLHQEGELLSEVANQEATVQIGSIKVTVPISELRPPRNPEPKEEPARPASTGVEEAQRVSPELKLIAQRVEPALHNLERYLDEAMAAGLAQVRIVHGMGTGALKKAVWEYLKAQPAVESYRLADRQQGGAGATIVELKK